MCSEAARAELDEARVREPVLATCKWHAEPWSENTLTLRQVCPQHHASTAPREIMTSLEDLENTGQRGRAQAPELWS